jgi:hypothetical protein
MKLNTYTHGFKLAVPCYLSKADIINICKDLGRMFGPGNEFRPEPIGNGFLIWTEWPGKDEEGYKCMRLFATDGGRHYSWPWIDPDVMEKWEGDHEQVVPKGKYRTFLKAFRTAPKWTRKELATVKECLERYGTQPGGIPSQKYLDSV